MSPEVENIVGNVVPDEIKKIIENQKYPSAKAFYTIGGSSLGVWLFNGIGSSMVEEFIGNESYKIHNCDAWLKLFGLLLSLFVAFVGANYLKKTTAHEKLATFFTGLLIFFCATSINSITGYFNSNKTTETKATTSTEAKMQQMGMFPFRNPAWFPSQALVNEVQTKEAQNQALKEDNTNFTDFFDSKAQQITGCSTEAKASEKSNDSSVKTPISSNPSIKNEILSNLASYKASVERVQQSSENLTGKNALIQKQKAIDAELIGFNAIINLDFKAALQAFQESYQAWAVYHNVDEINKLLQNRQSQFNQSDKQQHKNMWQEIFCEINLKYQWGMANETRKQFKQTLANNNFRCSQNP